MSRTEPNIIPTVSTTKANAAMRMSITARAMASPTARHISTSARRIRSSGTNTPRTPSTKSAAFSKMDTRRGSSVVSKNSMRIGPMLPTTSSSPITTPPRSSSSPSPIALTSETTAAMIIPTGPAAAALPASPLTPPATALTALETLPALLSGLMAAAAPAVPCAAASASEAAVNSSALIRPDASAELRSPASNASRSMSVSASGGTIPASSS